MSAQRWEYSYADIERLGRLEFYWPKHPHGAHFKAMVRLQAPPGPLFRALGAVATVAVLWATWRRARQG